MANGRPPIEPPKEALTALLKLRDYYAPKVKEYEKLYTQAKESLIHVEALLSNGFFANGSDDEEFNHPEEENSLLFWSEESKDDDIEAIALEPIQLKFLKLDDEKENLSNTALSPELSEPPPPVETETSTKAQLLHRVEVPMLPQYQSLSRLEAIEQLLAEHIGNAVHIDTIVRSLYGELEPDVFKVVKGRVQSSLTQGRETNKWSLVERKPGYYTLDSRLLTLNSDKENQQNQKKSFIKPEPQVIPMLKKYEGQFLIDALTVFLEQNSGEVFTVAEVITGIYGKLNGEEIREVKNKVLNELSRGFRTGRFSRVPDKLGVYTWDYKLVKKSKK